MEEYADGLVRVAMGRLFWSFDRAMKSDCLAILLAIDGQTGLLQGLFGSGKPAELSVQSLPPITQGAFSALLKKAA